MERGISASDKSSKQSNNSEQKKIIYDEPVTRDSVDKFPNQRESNEDSNDNENKDIENKGKHSEDKYSENNQKNGENIDKIKEDNNEEDKEEEKDINKEEAEGKDGTTNFDHDNRIKYKKANKENYIDEQQEDKNQLHNSLSDILREGNDTADVLKTKEDKIVEEVKDNNEEKVSSKNENENKDAIKKTSDENEEMIAKDQIAQDISEISEEEFKETFKEFKLIEDMIKQMRRKLQLRPHKLRVLLNRIKEFCQFDKDCVKIFRQEKLKLESKHEGDPQESSSEGEECH